MLHLRDAALAVGLLAAAAPAAHAASVLGLVGEKTLVVSDTD